MRAGMCVRILVRNTCAQSHANDAQGQIRAGMCVRGACRRLACVACSHVCKHQYFSCQVNEENKVLRKDKRLIYITYTEESLAQRKERVKGVATLGQTEYMYLVSQKALTCPVKKRLHFTGTNQGDNIGQVSLPSWDNSITWKLPYKTKLQHYGDARIDVGGPSPAGSKDDPIPKQDEAVPHCYHSLGSELYEELIHSYCVKGIIDLTCNDAILPEVCVRKRIPYLGVCLSDAHCKAIEERVGDRVFTKFQEEGDLYQGELVEAAKKRKADQVQEDPDKVRTKKKVTPGGCLSVQ